MIGFWHICTINDYYEIIKEQLELITESGLYDSADAIFVGVTGSEIDVVKTLFNEFRKIKILSYSENLEEFEFLTLRLLREKSRTEKPFYGFYFHTKGVSYPGNEGGKHWRDYMNYYILTKWKDNIEKLKEGFETCGVKLIVDGWPIHYSGNFFWFDSNYTKHLASIDKLNNKDRYSAEMWVCSNNPKTANLCDKFVDYNTKGVFIP